MENDNRKIPGWMGIVSLIMGIGGIVGHYVLNLLHMWPLLLHEIAELNECAAAVPIFFPLFLNIGVIGGIFWIIAGIGFFEKKNWAFATAVIGIVLSLKSSFWPNIPIMEGHLALVSPWFYIFLPNLVMYFVVLRVSGREPWRKIWLGLIGGIAFILNFINGIAATTRLLNHWDPEDLVDGNVGQMFVLTQYGNIMASIAFGVFVIGLFLAKNLQWVRIVGLIGTILAISAGFPLAIFSMFFFHIQTGFSMFIMAPVISSLVGIVFLIPGLWRKFTEPRIVAPKIEA